MARLFIAIRFNEEFKKELVALQDALKARGIQGNFCPYGNLHMTLAFIGESYDLTAIRKAVNEVQFEPFVLTLDKLCSFPTKAGVIWCGVKDNTPIIELAKQLREHLAANGVSYKDDCFFPHISLVQHPSAIVTDINLPEASLRVEKIYIMKSERIDGDLVYSEIN